MTSTKRESKGQDSDNQTKITLTLKATLDVNFLLKPEIAGVIAIVEEHLASETLSKIESPSKSEKGQESEQEELESEARSIQSDKGGKDIEESKEPKAVAGAASS